MRGDPPDEGSRAIGQEQHDVARQGTPRGDGHKDGVFDGTARGQGRHHHLRLLRADGRRPFAERPALARVRDAVAARWPTLDRARWYPVLQWHRDDRHVWLAGDGDRPVLVPASALELHP